MQFKYTRKSICQLGRCFHKSSTMRQNFKKGLMLLGSNRILRRHRELGLNSCASTILSNSFAINYKSLNCLNKQNFISDNENFRHFSTGTERIDVTYPKRIITFQSSGYARMQNDSKLPTFSHLMSYLDVCTTNGKVKHAEDVLLHFIENKNIRFDEKTVDLFNVVLNAWASEGNYSCVSSLLLKMELLSVEPNLQSFCAIIESIVRTDSDKNKLEKVLQKIDERPDLHLEDIFEKCSFASDQLEKILKGIRLINPIFCPEEEKNVNNYDSELNLDNSCKHISGNWKALEEMKHLSKLQLNREMNVNIPVESPSENPTTNCSEWKKIWNNYESMLKNTLLEAFQISLEILRNESSEQSPSRLSLYPYLTAMKPEIYIELMLQEMKTILTETEPPSPFKVQKRLGENIMQLYFIHKQEKNGDLDKLYMLYSKFLEYYCNANISSKWTARQYWLSLQRAFSFEPFMNCIDKAWPQTLLLCLGQYLREILMNRALVDANLLAEGNGIKEKKMQPALTILLRVPQSCSQVISSCKW